MVPVTLHYRAIVKIHRAGIVNYVRHHTDYAVQY